MRKKVLVAMSGGVDSSTAAYLLKRQGFDVTGMTMCFGIKDLDKKKPTCCGVEAIEDAKKVCLKLKIPHHVMDFSKYLENNVIDKFISEYVKGRTPNPCVDCNRSLKFDILLKKAFSLGFDYLATGHYARIEKKNGLSFLKKAKDKNKDQSYFLYVIRKDVLKYILFPLGDLTKLEVRKVAKSARLPVADKPQSQDICFVPGKSYRDFISKKIPQTQHGPIVDLKGNLMGEHKGVFFYTIGQRGGLGICYKYPLYVVATDAKKNEVTIGKREELKSKGLVARELNMLVEEFPKKASVKIRYNQKEGACEVIRRGEKLKAIFNEPQEAVTPGQAVVFYDKDTVLGGGVIEEAIRR